MNWKKRKRGKREKQPRLKHDLRQLIQDVQEKEIPEERTQTRFSVFAAVHHNLLQRKSLTASRNISPKTVKGRIQRSKNSRMTSWHTVQINPMTEILFLQQSISNSFYQQYNTVYAKCKRSEQNLPSMFPRIAARVDVLGKEFLENLELSHPVAESQERDGKQNDQLNGERPEDRDDKKANDGDPDDERGPEKYPTGCQYIGNDLI